MLSGLKFRGFISPQIFSAPSSETIGSDANTFLRCKNGTDNLYHRAKFGGGRSLRAAGGRKSSMFSISCPSRF